MVHPAGKKYLFLGVNGDVIGAQKPRTVKQYATQQPSICVNCKERRWELPSDLDVYYTLKGSRYKTHIKYIGFLC